MYMTSHYVAINDTSVNMLTTQYKIFVGFVGFVSSGTEIFKCEYSSEENSHTLHPQLLLLLFLGLHAQKLTSCS